MAAALRTLHFPDDYRAPGGPGYVETRRSDASSSSVPAELELTVGEPTFVDQRLLLPAVLINPTEEPWDLLVVPGVFIVELTAGPEVRFPTWEGPPRPPPVPPPPMLLDVPARTRVEMAGGYFLGSLQYTGSPEVTISWRLALWSAPRTGNLRLALPGR